MNNEHDVKVLNSLITTTIDSALGFEESAKEVDSSRFSSMFRDFARERRDAVATLQAEVRRLGGEAEDDGSVKAAAHRRWLNFRNAMTGAEDKAVLEEVENGETYIREKYEAALQDDRLSPQTRTAITDAYGSVRAGHETARALKAEVDLKHRM